MGDDRGCDRQGSPNTIRGLRRPIEQALLCLFPARGPLDFVPLWITQFCARRLLKQSQASELSPIGKTSCTLSHLRDLDLHPVSPMKSQRGRPSKRRRVEPDDAETLAPPITRRRSSFGTNHSEGHQNQGNSPCPNSLECPAGSTDRSIQEKSTVVDNSCGPSFRSPQVRQLADHQLEMYQSRGASTLEKCPTSYGTTGQAKVSNNLVVDISGSSFSSQPDQFTRLLQEGSNNGSSISSLQDKLHRQVNDIVRDRNVVHSKKIPLITRLIDEAIDFVRNAAQAEIADWKQQCQSLGKEKSVLRKHNEVLQEMLAEIRTENLLSKVVCHDLNVELDAAGNPVDEMAQEHGSNNIMKKFWKVGEMIEREFAKFQNLSRKETMQQSLNTELCEDLRNRSQKDNDKSSVKLKSGQDKVLQRPNALCGSYTDDSATPALLDSALCKTKTAVKKLQKLLLEIMISTQDRPWRLLKPDCFFARSDHLGYYVKSVVNDIFFEGFENESFNTISGVSRFLDPDTRQANSYEYYIREGEQTSACHLGEDPQFEEFCEAKVCLLRKNILESDESSVKVSWLEEFGGLELASAFKAAAGNVWLLHKLAFSFEPPAYIFRVQCGADVDPNYMKTVVNLEDNERFISKVGFMITPGLRIRKTVMPCEVYLAGATTMSDLPCHSVRCSSSM